MCDDRVGLRRYRKKGLSFGNWLKYSGRDFGEWRGRKGRKPGLEDGRKRVWLEGLGCCDRGRGGREVGDGEDRKKWKWKGR